MFRTAWFEVQEMDPGVHLISEPGHVNSFLIQGSKSAILFDTGLGVANIRKVAEELSDRRLLVVNSHYHFDHTGGNRLFEEIAIHRVGAPLLQRPHHPDWQRDIWPIPSACSRHGAHIKRPMTSTSTCSQQNA